MHETIETVALAIWYIYCSRLFIRLDTNAVHVYSEKSKKTKPTWKSFSSRLWCEFFFTAQGRYSGLSGRLYVTYLVSLLLASTRTTLFHSIVLGTQKETEMQYTDAKMSNCRHHYLYTTLRLFHCLVALHRLLCRIAIWSNGVNATHIIYGICNYVYARRSYIQLVLVIWQFSTVTIFSVQLLKKAKGDDFIVMSNAKPFNKISFASHVLVGIIVVYIFFFCFSSPLLLQLVYFFYQLDGGVVSTHRFMNRVYFSLISWVTLFYANGITERIMITVTENLLDKNVWFETNGICEAMMLSRIWSAKQRKKKKMKN